jgi:hypothetical protein
LLATTDYAPALSLCGQTLPLGIAAVLGRFLLKSRSAIWLVSFLGAAGAMVADILVDGQGACFFLIYVPIIYFWAVIGRRDLDGGQGI